MPLWNLVLSGYPASGKTVLARRLVVEQPNFLRLSVDDMRGMFFGSNEPSTEEEFLYTGFASLRDLALRMGHNVVLDCTAPRDSTRNFLLNTKVQGVIRLVVLFVVEKAELEGRNRERGLVGAVDAWDKTWETPTRDIPVFKFRNNSLAEFGTSYYVLTDLLRSKVHPYRRRFLGNLFPQIG